MVGDKEWMRGKYLYFGGCGQDEITAWVPVKGEKVLVVERALREDDRHPLEARSWTYSYIKPLSAEDPCCCRIFETFWGAFADVETATRYGLAMLKVYYYLEGYEADPLCREIAEAVRAKEERLSYRISSCQGILDVDLPSGAGRLSAYCSPNARAIIDELAYGKPVVRIA